MNNNPESVKQPINRKSAEKLLTAAIEAADENNEKQIEALKKIDQGTCEEAFVTVYKGLSDTNDQQVCREIAVDVFGYSGDNFEKMIGNYTTGGSSIGEVANYTTGGGSGGTIVA